MYSSITIRLSKNTVGSRSGNFALPRSDFYFSSSDADLLVAWIYGIYRDPSFQFLYLFLNFPINFPILHCEFRGRNTRMSLGNVIFMTLYCILCVSTGITEVRIWATHLLFFRGDFLVNLPTILLESHVLWHLKVSQTCHIHSSQQRLNVINNNVSFLRHF